MRPRNRTNWALPLMAGLVAWQVAGAISGQELLGEARAYDRVNADQSTGELDIVFAAKFVGFVMGTVNAHDALVELAMFCNPEALTEPDQVSQIVSKYLQAHPERWRENSLYLVLDALKVAFPCE